MSLGAFLCPVSGRYDVVLVVHRLIYSKVAVQFWLIPWMAGNLDADIEAVAHLRCQFVFSYKTNRRHAILRGAMTNFVSEFGKSIDIVALVTTLN
jgi:hypothetical protein